MIADLQTPQRITRLSPLADVWAHIDANVAAVAPRSADVLAGVGRILAEDIVARSALPARAIALRDGWAVRSELTLDAGPYSPALLPKPPARINVGEPLPAETDAVAPLEAVVLRAARAEVVAPVTPGEGVLAAQSDTTTGLILRRAGQGLRPSDAAILAAAGVKTVSIRTPRIRLTSARTNDNVIASCLLLLTSAIASAGGIVIPDPFGRPAPDAALRDETADVVIAIGGTGDGLKDRSVVMLAHAGKVAFHGIGIGPGETAAIGAVGSKPVLLIPGRLDAAFACWLVLGSRMLALLSGRADDDDSATARLSRKVASSIGIADVIPVRHIGDEVEPLAAGYLPLQALARADGWILVPADSEGYPAGMSVNVRPLP